MSIPKQKTIPIPIELVDKITDMSSDLEDWLWAQDAKFIKELKKIRPDHLKRKNLSNLEKIKKKYLLDTHNTIVQSLVS